MQQRAAPYAGRRGISDVAEPEELAANGGARHLPPQWNTLELKWAETRFMTDRGFKQTLQLMPTHGLQVGKSCHRARSSSMSSRGHPGLAGRSNVPRSTSGSENSLNLGLTTAARDGRDKVAVGSGGPMVPRRFRLVVSRTEKSDVARG